MNEMQKAYAIEIAKETLASDYGEDAKQNIIYGVLRLAVATNAWTAELEQMWRDQSEKQMAEQAEYIADLKRQAK